MTRAVSNPFDLTDKVVVVTGGSRGIGLGMARGLAKAGARLSLWARNQANNAAALKELESLGADVHASTISGAS